MNWRKRRALIAWPKRNVYKLQYPTEFQTLNSVAWVRDQTNLPSDRRLPAKLVPTFADRGCQVVSVTDPYGRMLGFLDRSRYFFFQVAPQFY
jgi:hypothetical protein